MKGLIQDKDGKFCLAKTSFLATLLVMLYNTIQYPLEIDYQSMAIFIAAVGGVYGWRSQTKAVNGGK